MKICSVDGCENEVIAKSLCRNHYYRLKRTGKLETKRDTSTWKSSEGTCEFPGCKNRRKSCGLCNTHYKQKLKYGKPGSTLSKNKGEVCKVEGCNKKAHSLEMCRNHYIQNLRHGDPTILLKGHNIGNCFVCNDRKATSKGMCKRCYVRWKVTWDEEFRLKQGLRNNRRRAARVNAPSEKYTRAQVLEKTNGKCALCGEMIDLSVEFPNPLCFTYDHILPVSKGGSNLLENVQAAHFGCNSHKRDKC